jgi:hypothetical protein
MEVQLWSSPSLAGSDTIRTVEPPRRNGDGLEPVAGTKTTMRR